VVIMIQTLPMPLLHKIAGLELSDVRITLAGTIVTANASEFSRVTGLQVENWLKNSNRRYWHG
jgi:hypothetical protein